MMVRYFGEIPSSIVALAGYADISSNLSNESVEFHDSNPPQLFPQDDTAILSDLSELVSNPPELSPQMDVKVASECQSPTLENNLSPQWSSRTKCKHKGLLL